MLELVIKYCLKARGSFRFTAILALKKRLKWLGTTNRPNPPPAHAYPTKISQFFKVFGKILKTFQIIENTRNIASIVLSFFEICGVKVSKIQVEREGGCGRLVGYAF
jgi:hypothetical protein